jgi:hypothetical protein
MKKRFTAVFITLLLALTLFPAAVFADSGDIEINVGKDRQYKTISAALEAAKTIERDDERIVINVDAGFYDENIVIDTPNIYIKGIEGSGPHNPYIYNDNDKPILTINASDVTIEMCEFLGGEGSERAVVIEGGDRIFFNCVTVSSSKTAIYSSSESLFALYNCIIAAWETIIGGKATAVVAKSELETISEGSVIIAPDSEKSQKSAFFYNCSIKYAGKETYLAEVAKPEYANNEIIFYRTVVGERGWTSVSFVAPEGFKAEVPTKIYEYRTLEKAAVPVTRNPNVTVLEKPEIDGKAIHYDDYLGDWEAFKGLDMSLDMGSMRGGLTFEDGVLSYSHKNDDDTVTKMVFEEDVPSVYLGGGAYRYADKTDTLILNDVQFSTDKEPIVLDIKGKGDIKVVLVGQNRLASEAYNFDGEELIGICARDGDLTIGGPGSLDVDMEYCYGESHNFLAKDIYITAADLTIRKRDDEDAHVFCYTDYGAESTELNIPNDFDYRTSPDAAFKEGNYFWTMYNEEQPFLQFKTFGTTPGVIDFDGESGATLMYSLPDGDSLLPSEYDSSKDVSLVNIPYTFTDNVITIKGEDLAKLPKTKNVIDYIIIKTAKGQEVRITMSFKD